MRAIRLLALITVGLLLIIGTSSYAPITTAQELTQTYDGDWSGTTSQGRPISFTVSGGGLSTLKIGFSVPGCGVSGTIETTLSPSQPMSGNTFSSSHSAGVNDISYDITGTFDSSTSASGSLHFSYLRITPSFCSASADATWTATGGGGGGGGGVQQYTIGGTVRDNVGSPLAGANVTATPSGGGPAISTQSAGDGSYSLQQAPAGSYSVAATKSGYQGGQLINVTLPPDKADANFVLFKSAAADATKVFLPLVSVPLPPLKIRPSGDTSIIEARPTTTFSTRSSLWTGNHRDSCTSDSFDGGVSRGLLRFDLSSIPAKHSIAKATLHLRAVALCRSTRSVAPVSLYPITSSWDPTSVTWETQPPTGAALGGFDISFGSSALAWYQIDMTDQVRRWASGADANHGLMVRTVENSDNDFAFIAFAASEWSGYEPYIELELTPTS